MQSNFLRFWTFIAAIALLSGGFGFYWAFKSSLPDYLNVSPETPAARQSAVAQPTVPSESPTSKPEAPDFKVYIKKGKNSVIVEWKFVPFGTAKIQIYRKRKGEDKWLLWKTIDTEGNANGRVEIQLGKGETADSYAYFAQGVSSGGQATWTSSSTVAVPEPPPADARLPDGQGQTPVSTPGMGPPITPTPSPSSTPTPSVGPSASPVATSTSPTPIPTSTVAPTSTPTPTPQPSAMPSSTATIFFPNSQPEGDAPVPTQYFWAQYVHEKTRFGWQQLPSSTDGIVIWRSAASDGPWVKLLEQRRVPQSGSIDLLDSAIHSATYYKMEAKSGTSTLAEYGPEFLPPL